MLIKYTHTFTNTQSEKEREKKLIQLKKSQLPIINTWWYYQWYTIYMNVYHHDFTFIRISWIPSPSHNTIFLVAQKKVENTFSIFIHSTNYTCHQVAWRACMYISTSGRIDTRGSLMYGKRENLNLFLYWEKNILNSSVHEAFNMYVLWLCV